MILFFVLRVSVLARLGARTVNSITVAFGGSLCETDPLPSPTSA
jgi:hypothetical protein